MNQFVTPIAEEEMHHFFPLILARNFLGEYKNNTKMQKTSTKIYRFLKFKKINGKLVEPFMDIHCYNETFIIISQYYKEILPVTDDVTCI